MKRSAILIVGLSVLVPYVVGVLSDVSPADLDADVGQRGFAARMVGLVPGFLAQVISGKIGVAGRRAARLSRAVRAHAGDVRVAPAAAAGGG